VLLIIAQFLDRIPQFVIIGVILSTEQKQPPSMLVVAKMRHGTISVAAAAVMLNSRPIADPDTGLWHW